MFILMHLSWVLLLLAPAIADDCQTLPEGNVSACRSDGFSEVCSLHANLTSALTSTSEFRSVQVTVAGGGCEERLEDFEFNAEVEVRAGGVRLGIAGTVTVAEGAAVTVRNSTLRSSGLGMWKVLGKLWIDDCVISGWSRNAIWSASGDLLIMKSVLIGNTADALIRAEGMNVVISDSQFLDNSGGLMIYTIPSAQSVNLTLQNCSISRNSRRAVLIVSSNGPVANARIEVVNCVLADNRALLLDFTMNGGQVAIDNCTGAHNSAGAVRLRGTAGFLRISHSSWSHTDFPVLWIPSSFKGPVSITNTTMSHNALTAPIHITNGGSPSTCLVSLTNTTFTDNYIIPVTPTSAVIYAASCSVSVTHSVVRNCTTSSPILEMNYAALFSLSGNLEIRNVRIEKSGGSGFLVLLLQSLGVMESVDIEDSVVGANAVVTLIGSSATVRNLYVSGGGFVPVKIFDTSRMLIIFVEIGQIHLTNFSLRHIDLELLMVVSCYQAQFYCDSISLFNISGFSIIAQTATDTQLTDMRCEQTRFVSLFVSVGKSESAVSNSTIRSSQFSRALFVNSLSAALTVSNVTVVETLSQALLTAGFATILLRSVAVAGGAIDTVLNSVLQSVVVLEKVDIRNLAGALMAVAASRVELRDCELSDIRTDRDFARVDSSALVVSSSRFRGVTASRLINLAKNSVLRLLDTEVVAIQCALGSVISARDSSVEIAHSLLTQLSTNAIDGQYSIINISETVIEQAGFAYKKGTDTLYRFGGAVACTDCPTVNITSATIRQTSADLGGAVYVVSVEQQSALWVDSSTFEDCWAHAGGDLYLRNVSFNLSHSTFRNSFAEESGGALDIGVRTVHLREILDCVFENNSAIDGGAVRWRSAQPALTGCVFLNNSATYGSEIASFGVQVAAAAEAVAIAPGQPTDLNFTLLDHYSQQVVTGKSQVLVLQSSAGLSFGGIGYKVVEHGFFNFSSRIFYATPNSTHVLIALFEDITSDYSVHYEYPQELAFRDCEAGEIKTTNSCIPCPAGYYSLDTSDRQCALCPAIALCPGGSVIVPRSGAWKTNDSEVLQCPIASACGVTVGGECSEGYEGPLCGHCKQGWFSLVYSTCRECPHLALISTECCMVAALWVVFAVAVIELEPGRKVQALGVLVRHFQLVGLLAYFRTEYPLELEAFFHLALSVSTLGTANFPMKCFHWDYRFQAAATALFFPCLIATVALVAGLMAVKSKSLSLFRTRVRRAVTTVSPLVPQVAVMGVLPLFACIKAGKEREVLAIDAGIACWRHDTKLTYIAASALAVSTLVPMATHLFTLYRYRRQRRLRRTLWSILTLCLNMLILSSFLLQMNHSPRSQLFIPFLFLLCSSVLAGLLLCFGDDWELGLSQCSAFTLIGTYSLLFYYLEYQDRAMGSAFAALVIAGNAAFFAGCVWKTAAKAPLAGNSQANNSQSDLIAPHNSALSLENIQLVIGGS